MWADILKAAPETMLLMKNFVFQDPDTRKLCADRLEKLGIPEDRFELLGKVGKREHFEMYGRVDLALDSFPYNGTTTTCEALWMGTPVLTLMGDSHRSRVSASLLSAAGYSYVITNTREEYIETAIAEVKMSRMVPGPAIRRRMQESMLMDAEAHTRTIEDIYRKMWKRWCDA
jgi:predicted O-linked N-acetylglucosamine transferase (SPINDLY family)